MIPAGLNFMATGCPYWSIDVGAFFTKSWDRQWFRRGEYPEGCKDPAYRELYCRMLQFATFLPVMRSHGSDTPREPWQFGNPGRALLRKHSQQHPPPLQAAALHVFHSITRFEGRLHDDARPGFRFS